MNRWQRRNVILYACDVIIVALLTMSIALLTIVDRVTIWEGFALAFLFMYWKQRYKLYFVRREREKLGYYENSK